MSWRVPPPLRQIASLTFESGEPLDFPTDFIIIEAPTGPGAEQMARAKLAASIDSPREVRYQRVFRESGAYPVDGQDFFLYERIR